MATLSIQRLPIELHTRSFQYLTVPELIGVAHVCSLWRELAFSNEAYWDDITVDSVSPVALDLAEHRIKQGGKRPLRFVIRYTKFHSNLHDPVQLRVIPLLRLAVPRAWYLDITVESMYRLHVEHALCLEAPHLCTLRLKYHAEPLPELPLALPLAWDRKLFAGLTGKLRTVHLHNIVLPLTPTLAFQEVDEVWWIHDLTTGQDLFPCYLFDFFPKATRLRMSGGPCLFTNAPLPPAIIELFRSLKWVDLTFPLHSLPAFFEHLPLDEIYDLTLCSPDEDLIYRALTPLCSFFHLDFFQFGPNEFILSVKGDDNHRVRRFAEPYCYYNNDGRESNALLENDEFMEQVTTLSISLTLWVRLKPWLQQSYTMVSKLIISLNTDTLRTTLMPIDAISFPVLECLVIQAPDNHTLAYVDAEDLAAFLRRLTGKRAVTLELRRVFVEGGKHLLTTRFKAVNNFLTTIVLGEPLIFVHD